MGEEESSRRRGRHLARARREGHWQRYSRKLTEWSRLCREGSESRVRWSHGVPELFDDGHMSIAYRYDVSLPLLARALSR